MKVLNVRKCGVALGCLLAFNIQRSDAQAPVKDPSNTGQLKRMVYEQWDDWEPDAGTHFFGILPNNVLGFFWWRVVNQSYYNGDDLRPYRTDGPFMQNTASLSIQKNDDDHIADTSQAMSETALATLANMSGGPLDLHYDLYFKKQFEILASSGMYYIQKLSTTNPRAYGRLVSSKVYADYVEHLDVATSRIETVHSSFVEKGARVLAYLEIKKQMEFQNQVLGNYIRNYLNAMTLPDTKTIITVARDHPKDYPNNDARIVRQILSTFKF